MEQLYRELYAQMNLFIANDPRMRQRGLSLHVPMKGKRYDAQQKVRLMWIGRAINGWPDASFFNLQIDEYSEKVKHLEACCTRFGWLKEYNYRHSQFWRTCKLLHQKLTSAESPVEDWFEDIVWTNLYNVSPADKGNPSGRLRKVQQDISRQLLKAQIAAFSPTHIVFVTDNDWFFDFNKPKLSDSCLFPNISQIEKPEDAVVASGMIDNSKIVVTKRPEYRYSDVDFTDAIIRAFAVL